jgi:hypothetical protein
LKTVDEQSGTVKGSDFRSDPSYLDRGFNVNDQQMLFGSQPGYYKSLPTGRKSGPRLGVRAMYDSVINREIKK